MTASTNPAGLEGVVAGRTAVSEVTQDGLFYRGYAIEDLAENASLEEVAYALLYGELPKCAELDAFRGRLAAVEPLPTPLIDLLQAIPRDTPPMDVLRTAVSVLGHFEANDAPSDGDALRQQAERLLAHIAVVIGARHRIVNGQSPLTPASDRTHAGNLLWMILGQPPDDVATRLLDVSLILYAEHEFNASTFTARVIVSTLSDLHSAVAGAIGALKGPLHGGANEAAMHMMREIGEPSRATEWVHQALASKRKIMGFGHRVYKHGDHRARILKRHAEALAAQKNETRWTQIAQHIEDVMVNEKGIFPNVDFPCAVAYTLLGLPVELFTPLFVASRVVGWSAHVIEQLGDNRLIRPRSEYVGHAQRAFVQIEAR